MSHHELTIFFLALAILLFVARTLGELARSFNQPAVLGEICAGIILGPTLMGTFAPGLEDQLFPQTGGFPIALQAISALGITLFLLIAGMEVDFSIVMRLGRSSALISLFGMVIPFLVGFGFAYFYPNAFGIEPEAHVQIFALFMGTVLAISALPVIARTLLDLNIFRTDFGMVVISVAVVDDLCGWLLFAVILSMMGTGNGTGLTLGTTIGLTLLFTFVILTLGRWLIDRLLPPLQAYTSWPAGVLGFAVIGGLLCAAFTEWIGIHSIFGAFLFGVALGDSRHLRERTRQILDHFVSFIFAPLFFATIGLRINFFENFDILQVLLVLLVSCFGKVVGCGFASFLSGFTFRESIAIGLGMNARGGMGVILSLLALEANLIGEQLFVSLVIMSVVTSMMAGGLMQMVLRKERAPRLTDYLPSKSFIPNLKSSTREEVIRELVNQACQGTTLDPEDVFDTVWKREQLISTGIGHGIAIPHARLEGLKNPILAVGLSKTGIDFNSPEGEPARLLFLILTPRDDHQKQLNILGEIGRTFKDPAMVDRALRVNSYVEFLAMLRSEAEVGR